MAVDDSVSQLMKFKVVVRLRPVAGEDASNSERNGICKPDHKLLYLQDSFRGHTSEFVFDRVFGSDASQQDVFEEVGLPLCKHVLQGYNGCCFAYGQTGSGKTFSMFGPEIDDPESSGVVPWTARSLFDQATAVTRSHPSTKFSYFVSFMEIYMEHVRDLGRAAKSSSSAASLRGKPQSGPDDDDWARNSLDIQEDPSGLTIVKDLTYIEVFSAADVMAVLKAGYAQRATGATQQNDVSSRSHTVFTISVVTYKEGAQPVTGRLHLVDLAGSERLSKSHSEGQRLKEAQFINKSLTSLGKVVMTLSQDDSKHHASHVPYRDSKLTRILKDSLQGNSLTTLLACLNPLPEHYEECFNTLQFAVRCQNISIAPTVNVMPGAGVSAADAAVMGQLQHQVDALREELEFTHAHYTKLIESLAPGWTADMGPLERGSGGDSGGSGPGGRAGGSLTGEPAAAGGAGAGAAPPGSDRGSDGPRGSLAGPGLGSALSAGGRGTQQALEGRLKRAEMQLEAQRLTTADVEAALAAKKREMDDLRDRLTGKERRQFDEIKKLREQVAALTATLTEQKQETQVKMEDTARRHDDEKERLVHECELLRDQLAKLSSSVSGLMEGRSSKAVSEQKAMEALRAEMERRAKAQVAAAVAEKERALENARQQADAALGRKAEELRQAMAEASRQQKEAASEITALQQELELLATYAERVTEVLRRMEAGTYGYVEKAGLRSVRIPPRERPMPPAADCLQHLKRNAELAGRWVEAAKAAAHPPPPLSGATGAGGVPPLTLGGLGGTGSGAYGAAADAAGGAPSESFAASASQSQAAWAAELRGAITGEVLSELRSDKTVEYIRSLEAQVARYRGELRQEKKRNNEMAVSLRSAQRVSNRPGSALQTVLRSTSALTTQPPAYGYGHDPLNPPPPGGAVATALAGAAWSGGGNPAGYKGRPATANGRLNGTGTGAYGAAVGSGGYGGGGGGSNGWGGATATITASAAAAAGNGWGSGTGRAVSARTPPRAPTATAYQQLTAGFREHGVKY